MGLNIHLSYKVAVPDNDNIWVDIKDLWEIESPREIGGITHNLGKMASECGLYEPLWRPYELFNITEDDEYDTVILAADILDQVEAGLKELKSDPTQYMKFDPENGWGSYSGLVAFTERYIEWLKAFPKSRVITSR